MNSNREMTKTKIIDHEETYNFVVDNLSIWNHLFLVPKFYLKISYF